MAKRWSLEHAWSPTIYQSPCEIYVYFFLIVQTVVKQIYFRTIVTVSDFQCTNSVEVNRCHIYRETKVNIKYRYLLQEYAMEILVWYNHTKRENLYHK